jgi:hypothetical protein
MLMSAALMSSSAPVTKRGGKQNKALGMPGCALVLYCMCAQQEYVSEQSMDMSLAVCRIGNDRRADSVLHRLSMCFDMHRRSSRNLPWAVCQRLCWVFDQ